MKYNQVKQNLHRPNYDPECMQCRDDCNGNVNGRCVILKDTYFDKPCPFYAKADKNKEIKESDKMES